METPPKYQTLLVEGPEQGIAVCALHRPEKHNALNLEMIGEIRDFMRRLVEEDRTEVLIFTGSEGRAFLAGADVAELLERGRKDALRRINASLFREIEQLPFPTIAAIEGFAIGGGGELALACDLRVCGASARFGQPEVAVGIVPGAGGCYRLPRLIGLGRAKELIYTGRVIEAPEAHSIGLVNEVVPDGEALAAAHKLAARMTRHSSLAVRMSKLVIDTCAGVRTEEGLALESAVQAVLFEDEEKRERMSRFLEKKNQKS